MKTCPNVIIQYSWMRFWKKIPRIDLILRYIYYYSSEYILQNISYHIFEVFRGNSILEVCRCIKTFNLSSFQPNLIFFCSAVWIQSSCSISLGCYQDLIILFFYPNLFFMLSYPKLIFLSKLNLAIPELWRFLASPQLTPPDRHRLHHCIGKILSI